MKINFLLLVLFTYILRANTQITREYVNSTSKYDNLEYLTVFRIPHEYIESYSSSGGSLDSCPLKNAFDYNWNTFWKSATDNNNTFKNEVTIKFKGTVNISSFLFQTETSEGRGYAKIFIFKHKLSNESNYTELSYETPDSEQTGSRVIFHFGKVIQCDEFIIRWEKINIHKWIGTAREIQFLQPENELLLQSLKMFNYNHLELNPPFNSLDKINQLEEESKDNINYETEIKKRIVRAKAILKNAVHYDSRREFSTNKDNSKATLITRYGDIKSYCSSTLKMIWVGTNRQPTGIYAHPGEKIIVYVEAEPGDPLPKIYFSQFKNYYAGWLKTDKDLSIGKNELICPDFNTSAYERKVLPGGPIYIFNPYNTTQQSDKVKIYIETGRLFPIFRKGEDENRFKHILDDYLKYYDNMESIGYFDMVELVGDRTIHTIDASRAKEKYKENSPTKNLENWDLFLKQLLEFDGIKYNSSDPLYDPRNPHLNINYRFSQRYGAAYAANEHIGIFGDDWLNAAAYGETFGWGFAHEIGHMMDLTPRTYGEATNNMESKFYEDAIMRLSTRGNYEDSITYLTPDNIDPLKRCLCSIVNSTEKYNCTFFKFININFLVWWHIESFFPGYWGRYDNTFRYNTLNTTGMTNPEIQVLFSSIATGYDLSYYFERWGYNFNNNENQPVFNYKNSSELFKQYLNEYISNGTIKNDTQFKLWYLDRKQYNYFVDNGRKGCPNYIQSNIIDIKEVLKVNDTKYILNLPPSDCSGHLGYEIYINNTVTNFTYDNIFIVENSSPYNSYSISAYDRLLNHTGISPPKKYVETPSVCKIGNIQYNSLQNALNSVKDGETIELLSDLSICDTLIFNSNINITITHSLNKDIYINRLFNGNLFEIQQGIVYIHGNSNGKIIFDGKFSSNGRLIVLKNNSQLIAENIIVQNTNINDNGGGIQIESSSILYISNSYVKNCRAKLGGGIHFASSKTRGTVTNVKFESNYCSNYGGGLRNSGTITVDNCEFINSDGNYGSALSNDAGGVITINNSIFRKNNANHGTIFIDGYTKINNCTITENTAINGAGIFESTTRIAFEVYGNTKIYNNHCSNLGCGINIGKGKGNITNAEIYDNNLINSTNGYSKQLLSSNIYLGENNVILYANQQSKLNGYVFKESKSDIIVDKSMFSTYNNEKVTISFPNGESTIDLIKANGYSLTENDYKNIKILDGLGTLKINNNIIQVSMNTIKITIQNKIEDSVHSTETYDSFYYGEEIEINDYITVNDTINYYVNQIRDSEGTTYQTNPIVTKDITIIIELKKYINLTFEYFDEKYYYSSKLNDVFYFPSYKMDKKFENIDGNISYYIDENKTIYYPNDKIIITKPMTFKVIFNNHFQMKFTYNQEIPIIKYFEFGTKYQLPSMIGKYNIEQWQDNKGNTYLPNSTIIIEDDINFKGIINENKKEDEDKDKDKKKSGLKGGAIAAIVISVVVAVGAGAFCLYRWNKKTKANTLI